MSNKRYQRSAQAAAEAAVTAFEEADDSLDEAFSEFEYDDSRLPLPRPHAPPPLKKQRRAIKHAAAATNLTRRPTSPPPPSVDVRRGGGKRVAAAGGPAVPANDYDEEEEEAAAANWHRHRDRNDRRDERPPTAVTSAAELSVENVRENAGEGAESKSKRHARKQPPSRDSLDEDWWSDEFDSATAEAATRRATTHRTAVVPIAQAPNSSVSGDDPLAGAADLLAGAAEQWRRTTELRDGLTGVLDRITGVATDAAKNVEAELHLVKLDEQHDANSCWSLLLQVNPKKCVTVFSFERKADVEKARSVCTLIDAIRNKLLALHKFLSLNNVPTKFDRPIDYLEHNGAAALDASALDASALDPSVEDDDNQLVVCQSEEQLNEQVVRRHHELDTLTLLLCRLMASRVDARAAEDLYNVANYASVNAVMSPLHMTFLRHKIQFRSSFFVKKAAPAAASTGGGGAPPPVEVAGNASGNNQSPRRVSLQGTFLISLQGNDQAGLKFLNWVDYNRHLTNTVREFVRAFLFKDDDAAAKDTPIFLNISMKQNSRHFQILDPPAGNNRGGLLALVQLAYVTQDVVKNLLAVKAYVLCTMSHENAPPSKKN